MGGGCVRRQVLELKYSVDDACAPFECLRPNPFPPFRDATYCPVDYPITLRDCFEALLKAVKVRPRDSDGDSETGWERAPERGPGTRQPLSACLCVPLRGPGRGSPPRRAGAAFSRPRGRGGGGDGCA